jgi:branched-subunit amino acid ABC-type transport system permease component
MSDFFPFIITGITDGSIYAIAALGLVLTYKTSGIFNFAHGAVAAAAAYMFFELWQNRGWPWPVAGFVVVFVLAPLFGLVMERLARELASVSTAGKIVATVGLLVAIQGLLAAHYGSAALDFPRFLPTHVYDLGSVGVGADQLITMAIALASAAGLFIFFRVSRLGLAMRGVVDNGELLDLTGISPTRVRIWSWVIGSAFAGLSGVLIAPTIGLDAFLLSLLVVQAFGGAAIGYFSSLPLTYLGALFVGTGAGIAQKFVGDVPALTGIKPSFPFIVLFVVLLVLPRRKLIEGVVEPPRRPTPVRTAPPRTAVVASVVVMLALLVVAPQVVGAKLPAYTNGLIYALLFASLGLLVYTSNQVSLCHIAFAAVGATSFAHLAGRGVPWLLAMLLAGLITVPIGAVIAIPAIRLSRLYLALATFGFGVLVEQLLYQKPIMFGKTNILNISRPDFLGNDKTFYYFALLVVLAGITLVIVLTRTRLGRLLQAMADSPTALSTLGIDVNSTRVIVFCISAFLAGISGALFGGLNGSVSVYGFNSFQSLLLLPVLFIAGRNQVVSPFIAAFALAVAPTYFTGQWFTDYQPVIFGLSAIAAAIATNGRFDIGARIWAAGETRRRRPHYTVLATRKPSLRES